MGDLEKVNYYTVDKARLKEVVDWACNDMDNGYWDSVSWEDRYYEEETEEERLRKENPAVKDAWEKYQEVLKLTKIGNVG